MKNLTMGVPNYSTRIYTSLTVQ